jgi:hypothetical protein
MAGEKMNAAATETIQPITSPRIGNISSLSLCAAKVGRLAYLTTETKASRFCRKFRNNESTARAEISRKN